MSTDVYKQKNISRVLLLSVTNSYSLLFCDFLGKIPPDIKKFTCESPCTFKFWTCLLNL